MNLLEPTVLLVSTIIIHTVASICIFIAFGLKPLYNYFSDNKNIIINQQKSHLIFSTESIREN
jgi:hypothetical protein